MNTAAIKEVLSLYTSTEEYGHYGLITPFAQNGYVYATNAQALIRFPKKYVSDGYTVDRNKFNEIANQYTGEIYDYWDYEQLIKTIK